jgi:anti-sigma B factor antagonist
MVSGKGRSDMFPKTAEMTVRKLSDQVSVIDVVGEVNAYTQNELMDAFQEAGQEPVTAVIFNFSELEYMNSSGIGLLVTLLVRAQRQGLRLFAYGLSEHFRSIFDLTRLQEAIKLYDSEAAALAAASSLRPAPLS